MTINHSIMTLPMKSSDLPVSTGLSWLYSRGQSYGSDTQFNFKLLDFSYFL